MPFLSKFFSWKCQSLSLEWFSSQPNESHQTKRNLTGARSASVAESGLDSVALGGLVLSEGFQMREYLLTFGVTTPDGLQHVEAMIEAVSSHEAIRRARRILKKDLRKNKIKSHAIECENCEVVE